VSIGEEQQPRTRVGRLDDRYVRCADFLDDEAAALDDNRLDDWLSMLHPDIDYRVPIRLSRERAAGVVVSVEGYHFLEDLHTLRTRVERLATDYAWAEDPPTRMRRFVTGVRVFSIAEAEHLAVSSNLLFYRERSDNPRGELISARREDVLAQQGDDLTLLRRFVLLDHTVIGTHNLSMLL
jgi:ethylbenzene dioxygenase subunit beta